MDCEQGPLKSQKIDDQKSGGSKSRYQKTDVQQSSGQNTVDKKSGGKNSDAQKSGGKKTGDRKSGDQQSVKNKQRNEIRCNIVMFCALCTIGAIFVLVFYHAHRKEENTTKDKVVSNDPDTSDNVNKTAICSRLKEIYSLVTL